MRVSRRSLEVVATPAASHTCNTMLDIPFKALAFATDLVGLTGRKDPDRQSGSAHDFTFTSIRGEPLPLADYAGRAVLVVNTASKCGFTSQLKGLQELHDRYGDRGFTVVGVPSNDFAGQEPGSETEIQSFCELNYGVSFPMTAKVHVSGAEAHPLFPWIREQLGPLSAPRWNFYKYLIDGEGHAVNWFASTTAPTAGPLVRAVEGVLPD